MRGLVEVVEKLDGAGAKFPELSEKKAGLRLALGLFRVGIVPAL
jgi:hypothetical protein